MPATAKVILLKGDPKNPESAEHIIKFPGGSISVCRTSDNEYWAHIEVNKGQVSDQLGIREQKAGTIVDARLDYPGFIEEIDSIEALSHLAVRIKIV